MLLTEVLMVVGFCLAAYAVVSNDSIQTLGTFIAANSQRTWWQLWLFASSIMVVVLLYGFITDGNPSYGRLDRIPEPSAGVSWIHVSAPLALLILTRFGVPVSTTFLVLSVFAPREIDAMAIKSLTGYLVAFVTAVVLYTAIRGVMQRLMESDSEAVSPRWYIFQWASTAFLWSQWLIQDLANIFVFLPRELDWGWILFGTTVLVVMQGVIFYQQGGAIQQIVTTKTHTSDVRSATLIDLVLGTILLIFKEASNLPMSTTWVFLGLLAGRELAIAWQFEDKSVSLAAKLVGKDALKAFAGLVISVIIALTGVWIGT